MSSDPRIPNQYQRENFDNVYTVEMKTLKGWEVIFTTVSTQQALNEFCRCDAEDDGFLYRLTTMLTNREGL